MSWNPSGGMNDDRWGVYPTADAVELAASDERRRVERNHDERVLAVWRNLSAARPDEEVFVGGSRWASFGPAAVRLGKMGVGRVFGVRLGTGWVEGVNLPSDHAEWSGPILASGRRLVLATVTNSGVVSAINTVGG